MSKKKGGLPYMALMFNVVDKKKELRIKKRISHAENYLLEEIAEGTIGARNKKRSICSKAEFDLEAMSRNLGYKKLNKLWPMLKKMHEQKFIIREHTPFKKLEVLGLNPEVFGQVLCDEMHEKENVRHLRLVRDSDEGKHTNRTSSTHESCVEQTRNECPQHTNRVESAGYPVETIEEKTLLDSSRTTRNLRGGTGTVANAPLEDGTIEENAPFEADAKAYLWDQGATEQEKARAIRTRISGMFGSMK